MTESTWNWREEEWDEQVWRRIGGQKSDMAESGVGLAGGNGIAESSAHVGEWISWAAVGPRR
jgi:hypothetical protein